MAGVEVNIRRTSSGSQTTAEHRQTVWDAISTAAVRAKESCPYEQCAVELINKELPRHKVLQALYTCGTNDSDCDRVCQQFGDKVSSDLGTKDFEVDVNPTL